LKVAAWAAYITEVKNGLTFGALKGVFAGCKIGCPASLTGHKEENVATLWAEKPSTFINKAIDYL